jgi:serine phosphatase RsbU (regulator of sigma subunit)
MLGLEIAAGIKTATEVGGDYYDFFPQSNDDSLHVVVGDATGHGMTAGMMVSITKAGLMGSPQNIPPNEISYGLNRIIKDIELGKNKMAINIAKFTTDKVEFTSAAMPPVYHYIGNTGAVDELLLEGLPLGSFKGETYSLINMKSQIGDAFVFLSDGLPEVENQNGEMLGYKAVLECIKSNGHLSAEEIKQSLLDLGEAWLNGLQNQDDITIVVVKKLK